MEFVHFLIGLLLSLDNRWLRNLHYWVPDVQQVLNTPAEAIQDRQIEIGPWTRYIRGYVVPTLLMIPVLVAILVADSPAITIGSTLVWLLVAGGLGYASRGGRCVLQANGVEFHHRGVTVFCPWDVFHGAGQPIYYPEQRRLDLPVAPAALGRIEVWKNETIVADGLDARASHFQVFPTGEIRLKVVYGVNPMELGLFLLELGRKLGRPGGRAVLEAPALNPSSVQCEEGGWIRVSLTRLRFPPYCCDCGQATDSWQEFRGYPSFLSSSVNGFMDVAAPVCHKCRRINRGQYWRTLFKTFNLAVIAVTAFSILVGAILDLCGATPGPGVMTFLMGFCGFVVSLGLSWFFAVNRARAVSAPLSLSDYRPGDGTIRIRFRNGQYAERYFVVSRDVWLHPGD